MSVRAKYTIEDQHQDYMIIRDVGGPMDLSITNDAEAVVAELAQRLGPRRLYYYDSSGDLDQLVIKDGRFVDFAPGGPTT